MKHKLLSTLALACAMFTSSSAFAWDAPTAPSLPAMPSFSGNFVAPEDGNSYYIYNVGTGQFLGCGLDWGTRAVTTNEALVTLDDMWYVGANKNTIIPFMLTHPDPIGDGVDDSLVETWMIQNLNTNKAETFLCHEGNAAWIDGDAGRRNTDNNGFWTIAQAGDAYELIPLDGNEGNTIIYGVHLTNMSVNYAYTWTDLQNDTNTSGLWKFVSTDDAADIQAYIEGLASTTEERQAAFNDYKAASELYNAQLALYNSLLDAEKYGVDATDAGAVYTNPNATIDELNAAKEAIKPAIDAAALAYAIKNASEENPFDITNYVLTNPSFDNGQTGWTITQGMGQNLQVQGATYTNGDVKIQGFIEAWVPSGSLKNGVICQQVTGLPEGRYRIEADVMSVQQSGQISREDQMGVYLYYNNGTFVFHSESLSTANNLPEHFAFEFDYDGAEVMEIGLMTENTNCNWMGMDNLKLFALGATKSLPSYTVLVELVEKAEAIDFSDKKVSDAAMGIFNDALNTAEALTNAPSDASKATEYEEAYAALTAAINGIAESEAVFAEIKDILEEIADKIAKADMNAGWDDLVESLEDLEDELRDKYENNTATVDDAKKAQEDFQAAIYAFIEEGKVKPGDDITLLLDNADFSKGSGNQNIPGWTIESGSITELSAAYHNIEAYHRHFDFSQTIKSMPAGVYNVTVQGFVRVDGWIDDESLGWGDQNNMILYAGASENRFKLLTEEYSTYPFLGNDDSRDPETGLFTDSDSSWPRDTKRSDITDDGSEVFVPNSMQGAYNFFEQENPLTGLPFYTNKVQIIHTGGDLKIGVKCNAGNLWILWDNFGIEYAGNDVSLYYGLIDEAYEKLEEAINDPSAVITEDAQNTYDDLSAKVANKNNIETGDEALALITAIEDAVAIVKADTKIGNELASLAEFYQSRTAEIFSSDQTLPDMAATLMDNALMPGYFKRRLPQTSKPLGLFTYSTMLRLKQPLKTHTT